MTEKKNTAVLFTAHSSNKKTGPIPVTTTSSETCPAACPLRDSGTCYAKSGPLSHMWKNMTEAGPDAVVKNGRGRVMTMSWSAMTEQVAALPRGQIWRHNQAGDLPHNNEEIDRGALLALVDANRAAGARGFTYTHHNPLVGSNLAAIRDANARGFTVNLSANNLAHADTLKALDIGPVAVVLPTGTGKRLSTPAGHTVVVCPATYRADINCANCGLCQRQRDVIVGFPVHGPRAKAAAIATSQNP